MPEAAFEVEVPGGDELVETERTKLPYLPPAPSVREQEEHRGSGHAVYRAWCTHCVAAKGQNAPHLKSTEDSEIPELGLDYGFMGKKNVEGTMPIICGEDARSSSLCATALPSKGRCEYGVAFLVAWVRSLGYKRVVFRSDNERSLLALLLQVSTALVDIEVVPKTSPEGDHQANGLAEVSVR